MQAVGLAKHTLSMWILQSLCLERLDLVLGDLEHHKGWSGSLFLHWVLMFVVVIQTRANGSPLITFNKHRLIYVSIYSSVASKWWMGFINFPRRQPAEHGTLNRFVAHLFLLRWSTSIIFSSNTRSWTNSQAHTHTHKCTFKLSDIRIYEFIRTHALT